MFFRFSPRNQQLLVNLLFRPALLIALVLGTTLALMEGADSVTGGLNDKLLHALGFVVLGGLLDYSSPGSPAAYWRWQLPLLLLYGVMIEVVQSFLPHRSGEVLDVVADLAGLLAYGAIRPLLAKIWRPS